MSLWQVIAAVVTWGLGSLLVAAMLSERHPPRHPPDAVLRPLLEAGLLWVPAIAFWVLLVLGEIP